MQTDLKQDCEANLESRENWGLSTGKGKGTVASKNKDLLEQTEFRKLSKREAKKESIASTENTATNLGKSTS